MENKLKQIKTELNSGKKLSTLDVCLVILSVLAIFCVIFSLFFMTVKVKQSSMLPSLSDGDILLALKTKNVDRGDIVVYRGEETDGELIIKRVIALEGDTFEIDEEGVIRITYTDEDGNKVNKAIKETYVNNGESTVITKTTVKQGEVYLLGDNRAVSYDSRTFGAVSIKGIVGKIILGVD